MSIYGKIAVMVPVMAAVLLGSLSSGVTAANASSTQCSGTRVPAGYVVTSIYNTAGCGASQQPGNTYTLATPAPGLAYCAAPTNAPAGYVITSIYNAAACGPDILGLGNTYVPAMPAAGLAICSQVSEIPAGWIATRNYNSSACSGYVSTGNTSIIEP